MRPSAITLKGYPPLLDTFGKVQCELAAAVLILTMKRFGDEFGWVTAQMISKSWALDLHEQNPIIMDMRHPHMPQPDFEMLVKRGFAEWGTDGEKTIRFTEEGLKRLEKWYPKTEAAPPKLEVLNGNQEDQG